MSDNQQINVSVVDGLPEAPQDGVIYGRKDAAWTDMTAPANLRFNRGSAADVALYTPLSGEPVWDEDNKLLYVGDGTTQGGIATGKPVAVGVVDPTLPSIPPQINSTSYVTPLKVTLDGAGSVWHVIGMFFFYAIDPVAESLELNLTGSPANAIRGIANIWESDGNTVTAKDYRQGVVQLNTLDDRASVSFDYIVEVPSNASSIDWGIEIRSTGNADAGFFIVDDGGDQSRIYARRLT